MTAPERPEGVPEDAVPVTVTLWVRRVRYGRGVLHDVYGPHGYELDVDAETFGIPVPRPPRPPRTGPLGLSELDVRVLATRPTHTSASTAADRTWNATVAACREQVAAWDAEDGAR